jgi:hypothetical protein
MTQHIEDLRLPIVANPSGILSVEQTVKTAGITENIFWHDLWTVTHITTLPYGGDKERRPSIQVPGAMSQNTPIKPVQPSQNETRLSHYGMMGWRSCTGKPSGTKCRLDTVVNGTVIASKRYIWNHTTMRKGDLLMVLQIQQAQDWILEIDVIGKLTKEDYASFAMEVEL